MDEAKQKEATKKGKKFLSMRIGQLRELEEKYPEANGNMARTYDRIAFAYATILTNSGIETTMDDIFNLPSDNKVLTALNAYFGGLAIPSGDPTGGSGST